MSRYVDPRKTVKQRLLKRCQQEDRGYLTPCFIWTGEKDREGYGRIKLQGKYVPVHWVLTGRPPKGMEKDHLCHQRDCVRPSHLENVTPSENTQRREIKTPKQRLTQDDRSAILGMLELGMSVSKIAETTGFSRRTVGRIKQEKP